MVQHAADIRQLDIYRGIIPFLPAPLVLIWLLFQAPGLALWPPQTLFG